MTRGRSLAFVLLAVLLFFGALEGVARLLGPVRSAAFHEALIQDKLPEHYVEDPLLGWRHRPGITLQDPVYEDIARSRGLPYPPPGDVPINALGLRDSALAEPRPAGQVRVLCLGDSSVLGVGAPRIMTYSERLEAALNPAPLPPPGARSVEVINAGVSGYSSYQSRSQLDRLKEIAPDVLIVYNMNSDLMTATTIADSDYFAPGLTALRALPLQRLAFYRQLRHLMEEARRVPAQPKRGEILLRVRLREYRANLRAFVAEAKAMGAALIFVIPTVTSDLTDMIPPERYLVRGKGSADRILPVLDAATEAPTGAGQQRIHYRMAMSYEGYVAGVPVVDGPGAVLQAYLSDARGYGNDRPLFADELHPSGLGHGVLADAILPVLRPLVEGRRLAP